MKTLILICCLSLFTQFNMEAQAELELEASQSMCITGKGEGQDGAINPFYGQNSFAIVENIGEKEFSIRVQQKGKIIKTIAIKKGETKRVTLLIGYELYFDTEAKAKAKVLFEKMTD
ncbi:hypothetical protein [Winogradskyella sp. R77965]|uniref:hypothetical protein n=1 Tax=Winogradskyella sp. R77965 TaxID=3093872 RepID=UPI0037DCB4E1